MAATFNSKREIVEKLKKQIVEKDSTAINTLVLVYANQMEDEQRHETVKYHNGIGFKPQDARMGCSLVKWYKDKRFFTAKQMNAVKRMVQKYAGQVVEAKICEGEIKQLGRGDWIWG